MCEKPVLVAKDRQLSRHVLGGGQAAETGHVLGRQG